MNRLIKFFGTFALFFVTVVSLQAQITQTIRGTVTDKQSESPIVGTVVQIAGMGLGATCDTTGAFVIQNVPTGRHQLLISSVGYKSIGLPNVVVNAGKETVLEIVMEEEFKNLETVTISSKTDKSRTQNELATISARQFNVEEVQRYSGGRNDVSRLAANFAGVAVGNDSRNDIVIRGNSPTGVLWRMEGVPIPNPNHFSTLGTTGGPVSALNPNMIRNSDFLTAAFPAEYGNALAGVFDIGLRTGNKEKFEVTAQLAAFSGLEAMVEGPFRKASGGSFVVAYRYSFVGLAQKAGINVGTTALPLYQDLTFNLDFGKTPIGRLSVFGIGGKSKIDFLANSTDTTDFFSNGGSDDYARSEFGVVGAKHSLLLDNNSYVRTVFSASRSGNTFNTYDYKNNIRKHVFDLSDFTNSYRLSSFYNKKFNAKTSMRSGFLIQNNQLDIKTQAKRDSSDVWSLVRENDNALNLIEVFSQWQHKFNELLTLNAGLHLQYLNVNKDFVVEPRLALNFAVAPNQTISLGYGMHHQMQPLPILLGRETVGTQFVESNKNLKATRSQHFVLGYDFRPNKDWKIKVETYYQAIDRVPVQPTPSAYSTLNVGADFGFSVRPNLTNTGKGENYGIESTIEKYFSDNWYLLSTTSIFDSKYQGSDNIKRNTAFNGNYVWNVLGGKEFKFGKNKQNAFTIATKVTYAGGKFVTPINLVASRAKKEQVFDVANAFSERLPAYFRWDLKIGYTLNSSKRKLTQQFFLDFQNVTNKANVFSRRYSVAKGDVYDIYQIGFFPDVLWRFQF
ncbi:MAG: hypothetical protein RL757_947 [Bacteroidota bacterium]|jgi:hypothetical protein